jgi:two-component system, NarL family, sensor histidine kinase DesK
MWPLIGSAVSIANGQVSHPALAAVGLTAFVVLYLIIVTNAFDDDRLSNPPVDVALLAVFAGLGLTLFWAYGLSSAWSNIILYVAVCGAVVFGLRMAVAWIASCCAITVLYTTVGPARHVAFGDWGSGLFGMLMACALVITVKRMSTYIRLLQATRAKLAETAVSEERLRFARDLHDLLGHTLSVIVVKAEVVRRLAEHDPTAAAREAGEIEAIGRHALAEIRDAVSGYREPEFATEVDSVRSALADAGIDVRVTTPGCALPAPASTLFGWAVREASTNAIRHSQARTCTIAVRFDDEAATLTVTDDGLGCHGQIGNGTGLIGLRERFAAAGGAIETSSQPGRSFQLIATVPVTASVLESA